MRYQEEFLSREEEAGLVGSAAYAQMLSETGGDVLLYVNFDMIGINWPAQLGGVNPVPLDVDFGGAGSA